jgi:hypothetical protein
MLSLLHLIQWKLCPQKMWGFWNYTRRRVNEGRSLDFPQCPSISTYTYLRLYVPISWSISEPVTFLWLYLIEGAWGKGTTDNFDSSHERDWLVYGIYMLSLLHLIQWKLCPQKMWGFRYLSVHFMSTSSMKLHQEKG